MEFISDQLLRYSEQHSAPEPELLATLNRQTHLKVSSPRMLSGHLQGRLLSLLSKLVKPTLALEIGTYTGYSALCLAEGLVPGGKLISIDPNEETNRFAASFIQKSAYAQCIDVVCGQAAQVLPTLTQHFDLVFIDADKKNYSLYFDLVIDKVNSGGLIIADNVLWSGKVIAPAHDAETEALHRFNQKTAADARVESLLLPVRDGLMVLRKR